MRCTFRFRLNHLASVWYAVLALTLQSYLLYLAFERYRLYTEMKWPLGQYPRQWLTAYISLLGACIPLMVLFAAFALFKSGNLAGDNEQLGARVERVIEIRAPRDGKKSTRKRRRKEPCCYRCCHFFRSVWQHSPPLPQSIHLAMALAQLVAQQLMLTQLYRFGFINSGDFLNTELDFAYQRSRQLATNLPMGDTRLQGFRITSEELTDSPLAPNLLPILMHARLFGVPLEFANLLIALFAYSVAYPSVFWRASRAFACCFSAYLLIHCASLIWTYLQWTVLFRVQETNHYSPRPVGIGQHLWPLRPDWIVLFDPLSLLATFLATMVLMQAAPVALYAYGYSKYVQCQRHHRAEAIGRQHDPGTGSDPSPPSLRGYITASANGIFPLSSRENSASSGSTVMKKSNVLNVSSRPGGNGDGESHCCVGYTSHVAAILLLILIVLAKAPSLYAMMLLYQHEEKPLILTCIILDILYLFSWIVLWLFLTLKRDWNFRVWFGVEELISLHDGHRMPVAGSGRRRTASDLKNAMLLVHGKRMYVTDDPLAKSSIWRFATKSDAQQRKCCSQHGCDKSSAVCLYPPAGSPALSYVRKGGSQVEQYVPLAAPPYQNRQQIGLDGSEGGFVVNTFGTLQRGASAAAGGDYGGMMSSAGYYSSSGHRSTVSQSQPSYMKVDTVRPPHAAYYSSSTLGRQSTRDAGEGSAIASSSPSMQNRHSHSNVTQSGAPARVYATSTLTRTGQTHAYSLHNNPYGGCYAPAVMAESQNYAGGIHSKMVRPSPQLGGRPHHPNVLIGGPIGTATPNSHTKSHVYGSVYSSPYVHAGGCQQQEPRWHQPQSSQHSDVASDTTHTSCPNSTAETGKDANRPKANGGSWRITNAGYTTYDGLVVRSGVGGACSSSSDTLTRHQPILTATMVRAKETAKNELTPTNSNGPLTATVAAIAPTPAPKPVILVPNSTITDHRGGDSAMALVDGVLGRGEEDASTPSAAYSVRELEEMVNEFATSVV